MRIKSLQIGLLNVDDGLGGDICFTVEARDRYDSERCLYLSSSEVDALLDWIKQFRSQTSASGDPK